MIFCAAASVSSGLFKLAMFPTLLVVAVMNFRLRTAPNAPRAFRMRNRSQDLGIRGRLYRSGTIITTLIILALGVVSLVSGILELAH